MIYENSKKVHLMVWETSPRLRNKNNETKVNSEVELNVGDKILGSLLMDVNHVI